MGDRYVLAALDADGLRPRAASSRATSSSGGWPPPATACSPGWSWPTWSRRAGPLAELLDGLVHRVPQVLVNVPVPDTGLLDGADGGLAAVAEVEAELGDRGRVLLRPSGTEPLVRVMVEAADEAVAEAVAERLARAGRCELQAAVATRG